MEKRENVGVNEDGKMKGTFIEYVVAGDSRTHMIWTTRKDAEQDYDTGVINIIDIIKNAEFPIKIDVEKIEKITLAKVEEINVIKISSKYSLDVSRAVEIRLNLPEEIRFGSYEIKDIKGNVEEANLVKIRQVEWYVYKDRKSGEVKAVILFFF